LHGRRVGLDECIADLVIALNNAGFRTVASCCGHGKQPGSIILADGRELLIMPTQDIARMVCELFPPIHPRDGAIDVMQLARAIIDRRELGGGSF